MNQDKFVVSSGIRHLSIVDDSGVDTGRSMEFNPSDEGFAEDLYGLVSKISKIHEKRSKEYETEDDPVVRFDISRAEEKEMRDAIDALFGDGFSRDVFKARLRALTDGLTVVEAFLYSLLDEMDESITANIAARDARIKKYTDKYSKYTKKYHG